MFTLQIRHFATCFYFPQNFTAAFLLLMFTSNQGQSSGFRRHLNENGGPWMRRETKCLVQSYFSWDTLNKRPWCAFCNCSGTVEGKNTKCKTPLQRQHLTKTAVFIFYFCCSGCLLSSEMNLWSFCVINAVFIGIGLLCFVWRIKVMFWVDSLFSSLVYKTTLNG